MSWCTKCGSKLRKRKGPGKPKFCPIHGDAAPPPNKLQFLDPSDFNGPWQKSTPHRQQRVYAKGSAWRDPEGAADGR